MLQVGYKRKEGNDSIVRLITLLLDESAFKEEWLGYPISEFEATVEFLYERENDFKKHDFIQEMFYSYVDDELKLIIKNDGQKYSVEKLTIPDTTSQTYTLPSELDMEIMRNLLENYLLENEENFIFTLVYDEEEREIKPFFTMYGPNEEDDEDVVCIPFKDMDALINYLRENEEGEDNDDDE